MSCIWRHPQQPENLGYTVEHLILGPNFYDWLRDRYSMTEKGDESLSSGSTEDR